MKNYKYREYAERLSFKLYIKDINYFKYVIERLKLAIKYYISKIRDR